MASRLPVRVVQETPIHLADRLAARGAIHEPARRAARAPLAGSRVPLPAAALVSRRHVHTQTVLTFRVKHSYYQVELHGPIGSGYATIKPQANTAAASSGPTFTSAALAIAQALKNLARTGGGALGNLATQYPALPITLLLALAVLCLGCAVRTFAFAVR